MDAKDIKAEFAGFGPIPSSKTTFAQGIGMGGSFAPIWTNDPQLPARRVSSAATTTKIPWQVTLTTSGGNYIGSVSPGSVAGIIPSNIFTTFTVDESLKYWICTVTTDGKKITSALISTSSTPPTTQTLIPSSLPTTASFTFCMTKDGVVYRTINSVGNPIVDFNQVIVTDKAEAPMPGIPGVDRWYQILFS